MFSSLSVSRALISSARLLRHCVEQMDSFERAIDMEAQTNATRESEKETEREKNSIEIPNGTLIKTNPNAFLHFRHGLVRSFSVALALSSNKPYGIFRCTRAVQQCFRFDSICIPNADINVCRSAFILIDYYSIGKRLLFSFHLFAFFLSLSRFFLSSLCLLCARFVCIFSTRGTSILLNIEYCMQKNTEPYQLFA